MPFSPEEIAGLEADAATDPDDPLVGTVLRNKWRVLGRIGSGSFGTVYKVQDVNGKWIEALKILSVDRLRGPDAESMRRRFLREAQIMKRLGSLSPHIVGLSTYEDDPDAGLVYFLMEHVEGRVLSEVLLEEGPMSVDRAIRIGLQVCDALIAAHESEEPVVHRDLKLENLMLTTDREGRESIRVLDFGIAKIAEQDVDSRLTGAGTLGTPGYAAPEQLRAGEVDGRTDLFAFGVILYSLVTGRNPWLGHFAYQPTNQTYELMSASDKGRVIPISETGAELPPGMVAIIMRLLQREPRHRFQSARELREALARLGGADVPTGELGLTGELVPHASSRAQRRLAAVWFADLVGYSTLSSQDEEAALALLDAFHKTARRVIEGGGGRIVQFIGDAAFAEFGSTQRAVSTAKDFLDEFAKDTAEFDFTAQLRIGVHVGDVLMAADGDLFGDGVNIAARIQSEAEPGQILVSQDVWRQLRQRRDFGFHPIGERTLKGIGSPVALFAVVEAGDASTGELATLTPTGMPTYPRTTTGSLRAPGRSRRRAAAGVLLVVALGAGSYYARGAWTAGRAVEPGAVSTDPTGGGEPVAPAGETPPGADAGGAPGAVVAGGPGTEPSNGPTTTDDIGPSEPVQTPTPRDPAPADAGPSPPTADPLIARFGALRDSVAPIRATALSGAHEAVRDRLAEAEGQWSEAGGHGDAGRYRDGMDALRRAADGYAEVLTDSETLDEIDRVRDGLGARRASAVDAAGISRAAGFEGEADRAIAEGRLQDALRSLRSADSALAAAATPASQPEVPPPAAREPAPEEIATDVLTRLEAAIEGEDLDAIRAVWPSMSADQERSFAATFRSFDAIDVAFEPSAVRRSGLTVLATVSTTYDIDDNVNSLVQTFGIEERSGRWVIVSSRDGS